MTQVVRFAPECAAIYENLQRATLDAYPNYLVAQYVEEEIQRAIGHLASGTELDFLMRHRIRVPDEAGTGSHVAYVVTVPTSAGDPDSCVVWRPLSCGTPYVQAIDFNYQR